MNATFEVKTTGELTEAQKLALTRIFEAVFHKPCPMDLFERKYGRAPHGSAVHSLMYADDELVGAFSAIPIRYHYFDKELLFAITADLMILPEHRGSIPRLQRLAEAMYSRLAAEGVAFVFCCLRDEVFQVHRAVSRWRAIGKVHYYAIPAFAARWNPIGGGGDSTAGIEKVNDEAFRAYRYQVFPSAYQTLALNQGTAVYARDLYYPIEGIPPALRLGLLIDVWPLNRENFDEAVKRICRRDPRLRVLSYQGHLPFRPRTMFPVPARFAKQAWTLAGRILAREQLDDRVFDIANWNINLSNGDLV